MARTVTLSAIRTRCKERADMENSNFISDAEWNRMIDQAHTDLWDELVLADPERYAAYQTLTGDGSTTDFACASDYYGTIRVDWRVDNSDGIYEEVPRVFGAEANRFNHSDSGVPSGWHPVYNTSTPTTPMIRILPPPENGDTLRHVYTVAPSTLSDDADTLDGVSGWEEYVVLKVVIRALNKEESNTAPHERDLAAMQVRLESMKEARSINQAGRVIDTRGPDDNHTYTDPASYWNMRRP